MYVKDRMSVDLVTISKDENISKALDLMNKDDLHRLPVVDEAGKLIGLITAGTIETNTPSKATSFSIHELNYLLLKTKVESIMIKEIITIGPNALLEEAALLMRKNNVGCLPVVEKNMLLGIITQNDIFDAFIDLLGYYEIGTRVVIEIDVDKIGILYRVSEIFYKQNISISHLAVYHQSDEVLVVIQVAETDSKLVSKLLTDNNYKVISVLEHH